MKKMFLFFALAVICVCGFNVANAESEIKIESTYAPYYEDRSLVTINVIEYRNGEYKCVKILTAQYHENDSWGFIHIGANNKIMKIKPNPYYGEVDDMRATYKYVAGNNYYLVNPY